jgi:hypothetical protein
MNVYSLPELRARAFLFLYSSSKPDDRVFRDIALTLGTRLGVQVTQEDIEEYQRVVTEKTLASEVIASLFDRGWCWDNEPGEVYLWLENCHDYFYYGAEQDFRYIPMEEPVGECTWVSKLKLPTKGGRQS